MQQRFRLYDEAFPILHQGTKAPRHQGTNSRPACRHFKKISHTHLARCNVSHSARRHLFRDTLQNPIFYLVAASA